MVLPAESKSASMRNGVSRLEYITNPEPLQIGNDFQTRIFKEFLHMFSRESRALARVCTSRLSHFAGAEFDARWDDRIRKVGLSAIPRMSDDQR